MSSRSSSDRGSQEPFLEKEDDQYSSDGDIEPMSKHSRSSRWPSKWTWGVMLAIQVTLIAVYTGAFFFALRSERRSGPHVLYSPASGAISWQAEVVDGHQWESVFAGKPSKETDDAWHNLLEPINLKVTADEMERLGQTSLAFSDGSGYLGTLGVYHELHCIKRLRKWFYKDYYYQNQTHEQMLEHESHTDHCLELLRQASICHGDTTITSFKWLHGKGIEPTTKEGALHQCVNWQSLSGWAKSRQIDLFEPGILETPATGGLSADD